MQKLLEKSCIRQNPVPSNVAELDFWKKEKKNAFLCVVQNIKLTMTYQ